MNTVALLLTSVLAGPVTDEPFSDLSFEAARAAAEQQKKILVVEFFCGASDDEVRKLDETTWKDEKVRGWLREHAIALKLDQNENEALARKLGPGLLPRILFVNAHGTVIDRLWARQTDHFVEAAERALATPAPPAEETERVRELIPKVVAATPHVGTTPLSAEIEGTISVGETQITTTEKLLLDGRSGRRQELTLAAAGGAVAITVVVRDGEAWIHRRTLRGGPAADEVYRGPLSELDFALVKMRWTCVFGVAPLEDAVDALSQCLDQPELMHLAEPAGERSDHVVLTMYQSLSDRGADRGAEYYDRVRFSIDLATSRIAGLEIDHASGGNLTMTFTCKNVTREPKFGEGDFAFHPPEGVAVKALSEVPNP